MDTDHMPSSFLLSIITKTYGLYKSPLNGILSLKGRSIVLASVMCKEVVVVERVVCSFRKTLKWPTNALKQQINTISH